MKKSVVILILLVAGVSTALAHSIYHAMIESHASSARQYLSSATCQDYQAQVRVGGVVKITTGKACQQADGRWRVYPQNSRELQRATSYHGYSNKACQQGKPHAKGLDSRQMQKYLNDIHGWGQGKKAPQQRFQHPPIKPQDRYHKNLKQQQPLLVNLQVGDLYHP